MYHPHPSQGSSLCPSKTPSSRAQPSTLKRRHRAQNPMNTRPVGESTTHSHEVKRLFGIVRSSCVSVATTAADVALVCSDFSTSQRCSTLCVRSSAQSDATSYGPSRTSWYDALGFLSDMRLPSSRHPLHHMMAHAIMAFNCVGDVTSSPLLKWCICSALSIMPDELGCVLLPPRWTRPV